MSHLAVPLARRQSILGSLLLSAVLMLAALSGPVRAEVAPAAAPPAPPQEYRVRPGDRLQVSLWGEPAVNTDTVVMPNGTVSLALVGNLQVMDKTIPELTEALRQAYLHYYKNPKISLSVIPKNPPVVYLEGNVNKPGPVEYEPQRRLLDYLGLAGGPAPGADLSHILISSGVAAGASRITLDISATASGQEPALNPTVQPGDTIWVGRPTLPVSVVGAVQRPGIFDYRSGWRLTDYVSMAGGPTNHAKMRNVVLKYTDPAGKSAVRELNLAEALKQPEKAELNPVLASGDIVTVPEKMLGSTLELSDILRAIVAGGLILF